MTTLLYGERPEADVEPGNRVDTVNGGVHAAPPPMRPPPMQHHGQQAFALGGLVLGLAAAAAVLAGLTITLIALVWSPSITPAAQVTLVVLGLFLLAGGTAYVVASPPNATR